VCARLPIEKQILEDSKLFEKLTYKLAFTQMHSKKQSALKFLFNQSVTPLEDLNAVSTVLQLLVQYLTVPLVAVFEAVTTYLNDMSQRPLQKR
jgi:hypothetical protein